MTVYECIMLIIYNEIYLLNDNASALNQLVLFSKTS